METDKELITVGQLVEDLAEFEEEYSDWDVVCWTPGGEPCYPRTLELDDDGDLCLWLRNDDNENYCVSSLLDELAEYDKDTAVYVAARGYLMAIDGRNGTFFEDCDEESDIDIVACHGIVIGEYDDDNWDDEE